MKKERFNKALMIDMEDRLNPPYSEKINGFSKDISHLESVANLKQHSKDTEAMLISFNVKVDKEIISNSPRLKYIGVLGTNLGNIDTGYAKERGITVTNIPGYCTDSVAEFVFAAILENIRNLEIGKNRARKGNYSESGLKASEIRGKKFGIIGLGRIGSRVTELALGFGANVSYFSRTKKTKGKIKYEEIDKLLSNSDFISINLSHNPETIGFFDKEKIMKIKKGAIVVCTVNMELIDINALAKKLEKKDMTFILDHSDEMSREELDLLSKHENCIIYPPIAYVSEEAQKNKQEMFIENITSFLEISN